MPLVHARKEAYQFVYALWEAREPLDWFRERLELLEFEVEEIANLHPERRKDWYATRYLIQILSGHPTRPLCLKDAFGKPHFEGSTQTVSISHSKELCAVILSTHAVGIDIQRWDPRMDRVAERFAASEELELLPVSDRSAALHVLWGAKESLYKAYGLGKLDFREHIRCRPFKYHTQGGELAGFLLLPDQGTKEFILRYKAFQDGMLVYALPSTDL